MPESFQVFDEEALAERTRRLIEEAVRVSTQLKAQANELSLLIDQLQELAGR